MKKIRIGGGAGFAGDRVDPAIELIRHGNLDYILFECLAERTIGLSRQEMMADQTKGYSRLLEYRMSQVLKEAHKHHVKIISNMGSVNPKGAVAKIMEIAAEQGLHGIKFAYVTGDDVLDNIEAHYGDDIYEFEGKIGDYKDRILSANAYIGSDGIVEALKNGADVVITGRVSDPTLTVAPLRYEFGWNVTDNPDQIGQSILAGHLLECGGQVTGGYYAEPGKKDVPGVGHLGFPIIQVSEDGSFFVTKVPEAGGMVTPDTCAEQICYEIHDPTKYLTPDVVADFQQVKFTQVEKDVVKVEGATGRPKTETFKCSIGYRDCFIGDGEISYGGPGCLNRAKLALEIIKERLELVAPGQFDELKFDLIGCNSLYWNPDYKYNEPSEVRVRVAGRARTKAVADLVPNEVEALYTNGPAGGCGAVKRTRDIVSVASILVSRYDVKPEAKIFVV